MKNGVPTTVLLISGALAWLWLAEPDPAPPSLPSNRSPATSLAPPLAPTAAVSATPSSKSTEINLDRRPAPTSAPPAALPLPPPIEDDVAPATVAMVFDTSVPVPPPANPRVEPSVAPLANEAPATDVATREDDEAVRGREITAIQQVLDRYKRMYDELDATQAPAIWPDVDSRALTKMFSRLDRQTLEFDGCVFALWENGAAANCTGWLNYVPRFGNASPRREPHSWTIELERGDAGWQIAKVTAK